MKIIEKKNIRLEEAPPRPHIIPHIFIITHRKLEKRRRKEKSILKMLFTFFSISIIVCAWCAVCLLLLLHLFIAHAYCFIYIFSFYFIIISFSMAAVIFHYCLIWYFIQYHFYHLLFNQTFQ